MARPITTSQRTYLNVNRDGYLYTSSREPVEGAVEVKTKSGDTFYHTLYRSTDTGYISFIGTYLKEGRGELFTITIKNDDGNEDVLTFPLFNNDSLNGYIRSLAAVLPNVDFGKKYCLKPSTLKNEKGYVKEYINFFAENKEDNPKAKHTKDNLPDFEKKETIRGIVWDTSKVDTILLEELKAQIKRFKLYSEGAEVYEGEGSSVNTTPADSSVAAPAQTDEQKPFEASPSDDLPF